MDGKRTKKREQLKERLIVATRELVAEQGLSGLRARDISLRAGCALGGLYTVFEDINDLLFHVNSRTLHELERAVQVAAADATDPGDRFRVLSLTYLRFAIANRNLWSALFQHRPPLVDSVPQWHLEEQEFLIMMIAQPLSEMVTDLSPEELAIRARTLFAAVHGIVSFSLEERFVGLPIEKLEGEVEAFVSILVAGLAASR